jgi:hypothetical protein
MKTQKNAEESVGRKVNKVYLALQDPEALLAVLDLLVLQVMV